MNKVLFSIGITTLALAGCTNDYTPVAGASGKDIFNATCLECHEAIEGKDNIFYELSKDDNNMAYFNKKISSGSLLMPKFPNISGDSLNAVSKYALEHSISK